MRTEEGSDTEELGDVVNVGPIGFAEGLDGSRETETEGDRDKQVEGEGGGRRGGERILHPAPPLGLPRAL